MMPIAWSVLSCPVSLSYIPLYRHCSIVKIHNGLVGRVNRGNVDAIGRRCQRLSSAFDTVDHLVLIVRQNYVGVTGSVQAWFNYLTPPAEGFAWDDLRKLFRGCQRMASVPNAIEILPKISTA